MTQPTPSLANAFRVDIAVTHETFTIQVTSNIDNLPSITDIFTQEVSENIAQGIQAELITKFAERYEQNKAAE